jgi:hypothetical protein
MLNTQALSYREELPGQMILLQMYARNGRQGIALCENIKSSGLIGRMGLSD